MSTRDRHRSDEDFEREIQAHLALETDRLIADGMSRASKPSPSPAAGRSPASV